MAPSLVYCLLCGPQAKLDLRCPGWMLVRREVCDFLVPPRSYFFRSYQINTILPCHLNWCWTLASTLWSRPPALMTSQLGLLFSASVATNSKIQSCGWTGTSSHLIAHSVSLRSTFDLMFAREISDSAAAKFFLNLVSHPKLLSLWSKLDCCVFLYPCSCWSNPEVAGDPSNAESSLILVASSRYAGPSPLTLQCSQCRRHWLGRDC